MEKLSGNEKKRLFFDRMGTVPLFFVNCSIEFLFGQKNGTDISKTASKEGLLTSYFFGEICIFKIHATDFVLKCSHTVALKICGKHS